MDAKELGWLDQKMPAKKQMDAGRMSPLTMIGFRTVKANLGECRHTIWANVARQQQVQMKLRQISANVAMQANLEGMLWANVAIQETTIEGAHWAKVATQANLGACRRTNTCEIIEINVATCIFKGEALQAQVATCKVATYIWIHAPHTYSCVTYISTQHSLQIISSSTNASELS